MVLAETRCLLGNWHPFGFGCVFEVAEQGSPLLESQTLSGRIVGEHRSRMSLHVFLEAVDVAFLLGLYLKLGLLVQIITRFAFCFPGKLFFQKLFTHCLKQLQGVVSDMLLDQIEGQGGR